MMVQLSACAPLAPAVAATVAARLGAHTVSAPTFTLAESSLRALLLLLRGQLSVSSCAALAAGGGFLDFGQLVSGDAGATAESGEERDEQEGTERSSERSRERGEERGGERGRRGDKRDRVGEGFGVVGGGGAGDRGRRRRESGSSWSSASPGHIKGILPGSTIRSKGILLSKLSMLPRLI